VHDVNVLNKKYSDMARLCHVGSHRSLHIRHAHGAAARAQTTEIAMNCKLLKTALLSSALVVSIPFAAANAAGFKVLHNFVGGSGDGASPLAGVAPAPKGGLYIATDGGGSSNLGTLTLLNKNGTSNVLHSFAGGSDGQNADGTPLQWTSNDNNIYGTTQFGGSAGCGTIYKYAPSSGAYAQVHAFGCGTDGAFPFAGLTDTGFGYLIGTGYNGGPNDDGTIIYLTNTGNSGSSCYFSGSDGKNPYARVITANGSSYTVTTAGGANDLGVVTSYPGESCTTKILHTFAGGSSDGATPYGALLQYNNALYGTASKGGSSGLGVVFRMSLDGSNYTVLHSFQGINRNSDGSFPHSGLTLNQKDGMLYGTTINGGNSTDSGTVFRIDPTTGAEKVVYAFGGGDGAHPYGDLYIAKGKIYGTTVAGGASNLGVVFSLKPKAKG
jgi:uncharacterized repeat protein (TIGR03803 family)